MSRWVEECGDGLSIVQKGADRFSYSSRIFTFVGLAKLLSSGVQHGPCGVLRYRRLRAGAVSRTLVFFNSRRSSSLG